MKNVSHRTTLALFAVSFLAGCGLENSVVGGRCRDGLVLSGDDCVSPGGTLITPGDTPESKPWSAPTNAPLPSGIPPREDVDAVTSPVALDPVAPTLPTVIDPTQPVPELFPPATPVPPQLVCASPLVECHGACIPVETDGANCGACGKVCASNICVAGECQGATPGDVVLIGHDYSYAMPFSSQAKVLVNALSIPTTDPIRVLSFERGAAAFAVDQARGIAEVSITGRKVQFTRTQDAAALAESGLARSFDVVLIHDASGVDPTTTGASWSSSLGTFAAKGGVVIALDRGTSPMPELLTSTGLLTVASHTVLAQGTHLGVAAAGDVIGAQVLSPYAAFGSPVSFQGLPAPSSDLSWVVRQTMTGGGFGDAVVVHRIVR